MIQAGIIGDYDKEYVNHINTENALLHAAHFLSSAIKINWVATSKVNTETLKQFDLIWCAPGSPYKDINGALNAIKYAREFNIPFIGTCGGFQHTVIEFARNVLGIADAEHAETNPDAKILFITPLVCSIKGQKLEVKISENSMAYKSYNNQGIVNEEYHCNYGLNLKYCTILSQNGLITSGVDNNSNEVRILELPKNDFFIATLFLPQSFSTEIAPHPLIIHLVKAAAKLP